MAPAAFFSLAESDALTEPDAEDAEALWRAGLIDYCDQYRAVGELVSVGERYESAEACEASRQDMPNEWVKQTAHEAGVAWADVLDADLGEGLAAAVDSAPTGSVALVEDEMGCDVAIPFGGVAGCAHVEGSEETPSSALMKGHVSVAIGTGQSVFQLC